VLLQIQKQLEIKRLQQQMQKASMQTLLIYPAVALENVAANGI
jgi:hypothetical protein